jgi:hypothetical protein
VCRNSQIASVLCSLEFADGTFTVQTATVRAAFRVTHDGRTVAHGTLVITRGRVTRHLIGRLARGRGRDTLVVTTTRRGRTTTLLTRTFTVA